MQPHSMCALALAGYVWNCYDSSAISKCVMRVEYRRDGEYVSHSYDLTNVRESNDRRELKVQIMRSGGGLSCVMNIRRSSTQEGSEITMTHETIHISGLREVFNLYKMRISNGMHYNSARYRAYGGEFQTSDRKKLDFTCEVKTSSGSFVPVRYMLERTQLIHAG